MKTLITILLIIVSYFIGNISPATILSKASGIDIRNEGSGNPGATNVLRVMGKKAAIITLIIDIAKGFIATRGGCLLALYAFPKFCKDIVCLSDATNAAAVISACCGLAVFCGHVWPIVFKFKGGKGVATGLGVLFATDWKTALICLGIFLIVVIATKMVSLGSIIAAVSFPIIYFIRLTVKGQPVSGAFYIMTPLMAMVVILVIKHRANIKRIIKGEENKLSFGGGNK